MNIRRMATFGAITVAAYFFADAAFVLTGDAPKPPAVEIGAAHAAKPSGPPALKTFMPVVGRDLFGVKPPVVAKKKAPAPKTKVAAIDKLPVARGNLRLLGTVVSNEPKSCFAMIAKGGNEQLFRLGQKVFGSELVEVRRRAVVLRSNGKDEALFIDDVDRKDAGKSAPERMAYSMTRQQVQDNVARMDTLLTQARMVPGTRDGHKGIDVAWVKNGSLFTKLGLRKGDFITGVNGLSVTGPADALGLMGQLDKERLVVDLVRNGKPQQLVLNIN
ncbi:general secretion pathway protein C [Desulfobaculum xiamenense]|uniref:General secretion pathway protein C n=1 Tax=Desulfobaculum xiamenense TaxID=995050 RepID=A0A846QIR1_9BACT|nr:type II secretion system protein N [Desulfobaculum xiamenense]NJB68756.1 general secretion pathway protein C [Desulfobaculum xiamenense]